MAREQLLHTLVATYVCVSCSVASGAETVLAANGKSDFQIVIAADPGPSTKHAAAELQSFLRQIAGATLPIVTERQPRAEHEILLGRSAAVEQLGLKIDFAALGDEGYVIRTVGSRLVIAGGRLRGDLYGVYGLLEDHLGCRWFTPEVSRIPKRPRLVLGPIDEVRRPVLECREPYVFECLDGDWCARNRMNSSHANLGTRHGGRLAFGAGFFVHTFARLVPPEKHFAAHPEYFSLVGGRRQSGYAQLCFTNEDVLRLCIEGVRAAMRSQPEATVFSVSQNDCDKHCECPRCQALARHEGTQGGPVFHLVNRVAEAVGREFPGKSVETLAYQWTRKPPRHWRPRPNVIVRLCSIECCFAHSLAACPSPANREFCADLRGWSKVSPRLWVWDYTTDFAHYLLPFPNLWVRKPNIQLFVANNVRGIFEQDTYDTPHSELAALGGYVTAKLLWDPNYDDRRAVQEFTEAYYGKAASPVRSYLDLLHGRMATGTVHVSIGAGPSSPHLGGGFLQSADTFWEQAEKLAAGDAAVLRRVQIGRMSVDYAIMERARTEARLGLGVVSTDVVKLARRRFDPFMKTLAASGLKRLHEGKDLKPAEYRAGLAKALGIR